MEPSATTRNLSLSSLLALVLLAAGVLATAPAAVAAGPPQIESTWVTEVTATSAKLRTEIDPNELSTTYRFEYLSEAAYLANLDAEPPREGFSGAASAPPGGSALAGGGSVPVALSQSVAGLQPLTSYRFRAVAVNAAGTTVGPGRVLGTQAPTSAFELLDDRGWELVSPVDKGGGSIQPPESLFGGGVFQAAAAAPLLTYSSADSFGPGAEGSPPASQYVASRTASGWTSENVSPPLLSGSYGDEPEGVPYQLFSADLSRALLSNGERCRGSNGDCPVANPPLPGSGAPAGYRDYYLRDGDSGGFESVLAAADVAESALGPDRFELRFAGASADLSQVVVSSCAALTPDATEVAAPSGCDQDAQNLYLWSGAGLSLLNLLPGDTEGTPGARLGAQSGALSVNGARAYLGIGSALYLREGDQTKLLPASTGGGAVFQVAAADGSVAYFTRGGHLYRYSAALGTSSDLTPAGGVQGVLGASADGSRVYYLTSAGLFLRVGAVEVEVAAAAAAANYPPSIGRARVSAAGQHLLFVSAAELTGYENNGASEVYLYGPETPGGEAVLRCVSCNPTGERPQGEASIPAAIANGAGPDAARLYKPRALSADGSRVFFESSDRLVVQDTNHQTDVYEWEAFGAGSCAQEAGCVGLISSGRSPQPSRFIDASADGSDAYFLTDSSLVGADRGSLDLYDARVGGGFPEPPVPVPCVGDSCQSLPEAPEDPAPGTLVPSAGNPPPRIVKPKKRKKHHKRKQHHGKRHQRGRG